MTKQKNIIVFVASMRQQYVDYIREYEVNSDSERKYRTMWLRDSKLKLPDTIPECDIMVECDFSKPWKIAEALLPYKDELLAITCRTEQNIARFRKVIPHVPYLRTPTTESLMWATDKYEMRKRLALHDKKHNLAFTWVKSNTKTERQRVAEKVGFPMIVKPANLAGSLFVNICYHEEELEKSLRTAFRRLRNAYKSSTRLEEPKIVAEQYIDGDLYSLDSYVDSRGMIHHCPLVRQKTARNMGRDDFYNYLQITPTALKSSSIKQAESVAENAIHALGLRSLTAHTEMIRIDEDWKIIEVGPRPGGMRDTLHSLSCDINHTMNDIAIRIPRKPVIPKKCKGFSAYMKFFADKEGVISETKGMKKIEELESFHSISVNKKVGDRSTFARNGGRSIFNVILFNHDRSKLLADIRRIEKSVSFKISSRNGHKVKQKPQAKKKPTKVTKVKK